MNVKTTLLASVVAICANAAFAGGLSPEIIESPVMEDEMMAPAGSSINPAYIVVGVLAALLIAAAVSDNEDDEPAPEEEPG